MIRTIVFYVIFLSVFPVSAGDRTILILADSLSASYGIPVDQGWVSLLEQRLQAQGYNYRVVNASISGDTTRGARDRLDGILAGLRPDITIVELGGNDGLRGIPPAEIRANLAAITERLIREGSRILLIPMLLPPNYGPAYNERFQSIYRRLAEHDNVTLGQFILKGIADNPRLMQDDGIHPRAEAQVLMLDNIWPQLKPMLSMGEGRPE